MADDVFTKCKTGSGFREGYSIVHVNSQGEYEYKAPTREVHVFNSGLVYDRLKDRFDDPSYYYGCSGV